MRKRKKRTLNLAVLLMVISSICLSTLQVGFSFFDENFLIGGTASIVYIKESGDSAEEAIKDSNTENITTGSNDGDGGWIINGAGYSQIIRGQKGDTINNYIKFSVNSSELWRIVGVTDDGIKVVRDEALSTSQVWDTGSSHWCKWGDYKNWSFQTSLVQDFSEASGFCKYLNTTYYESLTSIQNSNYVNPYFINHEAVWDITPMYYNSGNDVGLAGTSNAGAITCKGVVTSLFNGLPIGLLSVSEFSFTSSDFSSAQGWGSDRFNSTFTGWLIMGNDNRTEYTITEAISAYDIINNYPTTEYAVYFNQQEFQKLSKSTSGDMIFRPAMYLYSNVLFGVMASGTGEAGSATNPFIVTGRSSS